MPKDVVASIKIKEPRRGICRLARRSVDRSVTQEGLGIFKLFIDSSIFVYINCCFRSFNNVNVILYIPKYAN